MQCFTPFQVKNKHKDTQNQNMYVSVPCGKCIACRKRRAGHWSFRLNEEAQLSSSASFVTLTYAPGNCPISENGFRTLSKRDYQLFFKKLRKLTKNKLKYYMCGEYGSEDHTLRPHYHIVLLNLPHDIIKNHEQFNPEKPLNKIWGHGYVHLTSNSIKSINYVVGYLTKGNYEKINKYDDRQPEFSLMSKGLGAGYLTPAMTKYYQQRQIFCIVRQGGQIISMPKYYKEQRIVNGKLYGLYNKKQLTKLYKDYIEETEIDFEEMFNSPKDKHEYYKNIIRKDLKENKLKRQLL